MQVTLLDSYTIFLLPWCSRQIAGRDNNIYIYIYIYIIIIIIYE